MGKYEFYADFEYFWKFWEFCKMVPKGVEVMKKVENKLDMNNVDGI